MAALTDAENRFYHWCFFERRAPRPVGGIFAEVEKVSFSRMQLLWRLNERWKFHRDPGPPSTMLKILA